MSKEVDLIIEKYIKKYGRSISAAPIDIFNFLMKKNKNNYKKVIDYDKYFAKKENEMEYNLFKLLLTGEFSKMFFKNENAKSLKQVLLGPFIVNLKNKIRSVTISLDKKKELQLMETSVFAFYNETQKKFMWTFPKDINDMCKNGIFEKLTFCKANMITNININEADAIALWYRTHIYYERNMIKNNIFKNFKTTNLIKYQLQDKGDIYVIFTLVDYGIPDPKPNKKIENSFNDITSLSSMLNQVNNKKNSMKGFKLDSVKVSNKESFKSLKKNK